MRRFRIKIGGRWYTVEVEDTSTTPIKVTVEGETFYVEAEGLGRRLAPRPAVNLSRPASPAPPATAPSPTTRSDANLVTSPMPGRVISVHVTEGQEVRQGEELCVVEAMKMEQSIRAPRDARVKRVLVQRGQQVGRDQPLVELG